MKIGAKITLTMLGSIGILLVALCIVAVVQINSVLQPLNENYSSEIVKARSAEISQWIEGKINLLTAISRQDAYRSGDMAAIRDTMDAITTIPDPDFKELVYANVDGITYSNLKTIVDVNERPYFYEVMKGNNEFYINNAVISKADGDSIFLISRAVYDEDGNKNGIVFGVISLKHLSEVTGEITVGEAGYAWIVDGNGLVIAHPVEEYLNTLSVGDLEEAGYTGATEAAADIANGISDFRWIGSPEGGRTLWTYQPIPGTPNWFLGVVVPREQIIAASRTLMYVIIVTSAVIMLVIAVTTILFGRSISRPLGLVAGSASLLSVGDIEQKSTNWNRIEALERRKDELGTVGRALRQLIDYQQEKVTLAQRIADGDIRIDVTVSSDEDRLGLALAHMVDSLNDLLGRITVAVDQVTSGSDQVSQASQSLSQGATEQASSLEEISSSTSEINSQARQNAESATEANSLAKQSAATAESGNNEMKTLTTAMEAINNSSDEIKKVVKVIDDIAFQINLLALNANVEAARAGKYGKGFAVVAEEVRHLAVKSADAVKDTTKMVEDSIRNIDAGNRSVQTTAGKLGEIMSGVARVTDILDEIAVASSEQAKGIEQITNGLTQIEQVTHATTASAEESAAASEELSGQAQELLRLISRFKLKDFRNLYEAESQIELSDEDVFMPVVRGRTK